jgi:hypothetical protein
MAARAIGVPLACLLLAAGCVSTRPFRGPGGQLLPWSIATMEDVPIGGVSQRIWFGARDVQRPALVLLHGGPGARRRFASRAAESYVAAS